MFTQGLHGDAPISHHVGTEVVCKNVELWNQAPEHVATPGIRHIECNGAFVEINGVVHAVVVQRILFDIRVANGRRDRRSSATPDVGSFAAFDLNYISTEQSQQLGREGAGPRLRKREYSDPL